MNTRTEQIKKLADIIEQNPKCLFNIDNDGWYITDITGEQEIADSYQYQWNTEWYSYSNIYGSGLAEVLIELLNRRGFDIAASAV